MTRDELTWAWKRRTPVFIVEVVDGRPYGRMAAIKCDPREVERLTLESADYVHLLSAGTRNPVVRLDDCPFEKVHPTAHAARRAGFVDLITQARLKAQEDPDGTLHALRLDAELAALDAADAQRKLDGAQQALQEAEQARRMINV